MNQKPGASSNSVEQDQNPEKPFRILNLTFASRKIFIEFLLTSLLIILVPIASVALLHGWVKDDPNISQLKKVLIAVGPAVVFINIVMCCYVWRAIRDPQNYKVDPPLKIKLKVR